MRSVRLDPDHDAIMRIGGKAPGGGPILSVGIGAMSTIGFPPPVPIDPSWASKKLHAVLNRRHGRQFEINSDALCSQDWVSAYAPRPAREMLKALRQANLRSSSRTPTGLPAITSCGPGTGYAATGTTQASASS